MLIVRSHFTQHKMLRKSKQATILSAAAASSFKEEPFMSTLALSSATNPQRIPSRMIVRPHSSSIHSSRCSGAKPDACRAATEGVTFTRRMALVSATSLTTLFLGPSGEGFAAAVKQGPLAGRIPGLSEPDEQGWRTYCRPEDKSGGHGVGWSPIIPYAFSVPRQWEEVPVSIADLGGTEIDLRFASPKEGRLFVIVAPVARFANDLGDEVRITLIGPPDKVINAFGPEVIGENVEGKVMSTSVVEHSGRTYYQFELEPPHCLITATAAGNRLYLFNVVANGLQWKRHYDDLKRIADSFRVV